MKKFADLSPEEQEIEMNAKVVLIDERNNIDLMTQFEVAILLLDKPDLASTYAGLNFLARVKWLHDSTQAEIAEFLGLSRPSYASYRDRLQDMGLINVEGKWKNIFITLNNVTRLPKFNDVKGHKYRKDYLEKVRQQISPITPEVKVKEQKILEQKQEQLFIDQQANEKAKEIVKARQKAKLAKEPKFPPQDYISVIDGYKKNKGVFIQRGSPDEMRVRRAAKLMFMSGHKVFEILECMRFFNKYCKREEYAWMYSWTIETIAKKMPEFKAGKLKLPEMGDDLERI